MKFSEVKAMLTRTEIRIKEIGVALLLSCIIVASIGALTGSSVAKTESVTILVDRTNKGDRLPLTSTVEQLPDESSRTETISPKRVPIGCDPAFSPVVNPERAPIFRRAIV
jgi:hypothetical protein